MSDIIKLLANGYAELQAEAIEASTVENYDPTEDTLPLYVRLTRGFERQSQSNKDARK